MKTEQQKKNSKGILIAVLMIVGYFSFQAITFFVIRSGHSRPASQSDLSFSISNDRSKVVYSDHGNGGRDLYILDLKSGKSERITDGPYYDLYPSFSPDNRRLVFTRGAPKNRADQLCIMDLATKKIEQLTNADENISTPVFTPDGKSVIYALDTKFRFGLSSSWMERGALVKHDLSTMKREILLPESSRSDQPRFSPDGKQVVWFSEDGICIAPSDNIKDFKILVNGGRSPAFSPDGKKIAYVTWKIKDDSQVEIVLAEGKGNVSVPNTEGASEVTYLADGSLLVLMNYSSDTSSARNRMFKIAPDGSQKTKFVP